MNDRDMNQHLLSLRLWWRRHWWPSRIEQLDRERMDWKRWCRQAELVASTQYERGWEAAMSQEHPPEVGSNG